MPIANPPMRPKKIVARMAEAQSQVSPAVMLPPSAWIKAPRAKTIDDNRNVQNARRGEGLRGG